MDEREQELSELRDYGYKLLEEMKYPNIISMLQETITHIADIAEEYSGEADKWHSKYDECAKQNENLREQIKDLTNTGEQQNKEFRAVIGEQAKKIEDISREFEKKLDELRFYRDQEIEDYRNKVQALTATQKTLDEMIVDVKSKKRQLENDIQRCNEEKAKYEDTRLEYAQQIEDNQTKLDEYESLFKYKMEAETKITKIQNEADNKVSKANSEIAELTKKYNDETDLRQKLEKELDVLKNQLQNNADNLNSEEQNLQNGIVEQQEKQPSQDDDEDGTR